jgi:hypothetical protein
VGANRILAMFGNGDLLLDLLQLRSHTLADRPRSGYPSFCQLVELRAQFIRCRCPRRRRVVSVEVASIGPGEREAVATRRGARHGLSTDPDQSCDLAGKSTARYEQESAIEDSLKRSSDVVAHAPRVKCRKRSVNEKALIVAAVCRYPWIFA